jgi:hypothetical protein
MTGFPEEGWLFTRGPQSGRLVREEHSAGCRLLVSGPGTVRVTYDFRDITECVKRQAEIEQIFLAEGYQLTRPSSDRRNDAGIWAGSDLRRAASPSPGETS